MRKCYRFAMTGLVAVGLAAGVSLASAAFVNPIVDFAPGYAAEGTRAVEDHTSTPGDQLVIVGHVAAFNEPFDDLDPNDPTKEYTYVYTSFISQGTLTSGSPGFFFYDTDYGNGILRVYCDPAMDADFANPASFQNGDMILEAAITGAAPKGMVTSTRSFQASGNQNGDLEFTGGSLFSRVSQGGNGLTGIITGGFSVSSSFVPAARQAEGYFGWSDTKIDVNIPVPVDASTWGRIKTLGN